MLATRLILIIALSLNLKPTSHFSISVQSDPFTASRASPGYDRPGERSGALVQARTSHCHSSLSWPSDTRGRQRKAASALTPLLIRMVRSSDAVVQAALTRFGKGYMWTSGGEDIADFTINKVMVSVQIP